MQLRLQLHASLRVVNELLEYNPPVLMESEELHGFLALLGLSPSSSSWAEVMSMCAAAHLASGNVPEAQALTEKLLANGHPAVWKLALGLTSGESAGPLHLDHGSDLLADAAKVCPAEDLPRLLGFFQHGQDDHGAVSMETEAEKPQAAMPAACVKDALSAAA